jgi:hypothetical protein
MESIPDFFSSVMQPPAAHYKNRLRAFATRSEANPAATEGSFRQFEIHRQGLNLGMDFGARAGLLGQKEKNPARRERLPMD